MSDERFNATVESIDNGIDALSQFLNDCETLGKIASRYPVETKLGNAVGRAYSVFMAKVKDVGVMLDPSDATEFVS